MTEPRSGLWQRLKTPPRPAAALYAWALVAPLAVLVLGFKLHKLISVDAPVGIFGTIGGLGLDIVVLGALGVLFTYALSAARGRGLLPTRIGCHLLVFVLATLAVVEHGFFMATGSLLDAYLLGYGLNHMGELGEVFLSEMGVVVYLTFGLIVLTNLVPLWMVRRPRYKAAREERYTPGAWRERPVRTVAMVVGLTMIVALMASALSLPNLAEPLRDNVFVAFADDALAGIPDADDVHVHGDPTIKLELTEDPEGPRPNVVLLILESSRARSFTPYSPELDTTPFFAELAKRGALVDNAYTVVPHTSKALVSILCGIYPRIDTPIDEAQPDAVPTRCLADLLGERGYQTGFFQAATETFERRDQLVANARYQDFYPKEGMDTEGFHESSYFGFEDNVMVEPAMRWVDGRDKAKPFFMSMLTLTSHHDYTVPRGFPRKRMAEDKHLDGYLNTLRYTDAFMKKLFDGFEARGLVDNTVFIIVGDHGEGFGEHARFQHDNTIYEEGLRVPLLVLGPNVEAGVRIRGLRQIIDIMPTILEQLGIVVESGLPGKSLLTSQGHDKVFASCWYRNRCMALRTGDKKFIYHYNRQPSEVYDLARDPLETDNLLSKGAFPKTQADRWRSELLRWKAEVNARYEAHFAKLRSDYVSFEKPTPTIPMDITIGEQVRLVGIDAPKRVIRQGEPLKVTYYWECLRPLADEWRIFTHIIGTSPGAKRYVNADHQPVGGRHPWQEWYSGQYVSDVHTFQPRHKLPPGTYDITIGLWSPKKKGKIEVTRGLPVGEGAEIDKHRRVHVLSFKVLPDTPELPEP